MHKIAPVLFFFFLVLTLAVFIDQVRQSQEIASQAATNIVGIRPLENIQTRIVNGIARVRDKHLPSPTPIRTTIAPNPTTPPNRPTATPTPHVLSNMFGVMLQSSNTSIAQEIQISKNLGAVYYRPSSIFMDQWQRAGAASPCPQCDAAKNAGLKLILTIRTNGSSQTPSTPPTDMNAYRAFVDAVIKRYTPQILVVENEENSQALFYAGTTEQYLAELKAACEVAHSNNTKCANGGLVSSLVVSLVAENYRSTRGATAADAYYAKALSVEKRQQLDRPNFADQVARGNALLRGYRDAGADYVNFHWYAYPEAFIEALQYVELSSGLPAISNEIGQQESGANQTTSMMTQAYQNELPYAVWFSIQVNNAFALQEANGTLNARGEAFKSFISTHF